MAECDGAPRAWYCKRKAGHPPPHALVPRWWNALWWWGWLRG